MIAGEGVVGIILAVLAVLKLDPDISKLLSLGNIGGILFFVLLIATQIYFMNRKTAEKKQAA